VKDLLTQKLTAEKQKAVFDSYIEGLKSSYKVEINKDAIAKLAAAKPEAPTAPAQKEKK
jgi:hypothetical protein